MLPLADAYAVACSFFCYFRWSGEQTLSVRALRICVRWMPVRACVSMCALIKAFGTGFMRLHAFVAVCCFLLNLNKTTEIRSENVVKIGTHEHQGCEAAKSINL